MPGFDGFTNHRVTVQSECLVSQLEIFARKGGSGPGLLLLHGYPQTSQYVRCVQLMECSPIIKGSTLLT